MPDTAGILSTTGMAVAVQLLSLAVAKGNVTAMCFPQKLPFEELLKCCLLIVKRI